jgi:ribosomal protein S18 acetylase RimI-like enzyme
VTRRDRFHPATVRAAHGDAWQAEGRARRRHGGGALELPGIRLMASGLPHPRWNSGHVDDPDVGLGPVREFYAARTVPWGVRVPSGMPWRHGRQVLRTRCMAVGPRSFRPAPAVPGVRVRAAGPADLDAAAWVDATAFGGSAELSRRWVGPQVGAFDVVLAVAADDQPLGIAVGIHTDDRAGPAVGVFGVGVVPAARRRGVGAALTTAVLRRGFGSGARLAHLTPDTGAAARLYRRLGFAETGGFDVYVDL